MLSAIAIEGLPEVREGDDLGQLIVSALGDGPAPDDGDVLVVAHKVISKAEGQTRRLSAIDPSPRAVELASALDKDARHVQVILDESQDVLRAVRGVLICVTRHGFVCANAGVDASNVPGTDEVVVLPTDPDASARQLRRRIRELIGTSPAVLITDSFGRAWRLGQCDIAVGCAGLEPVDDWRGRNDANGRELKATVIAIADELAAAADLVRSKDQAQPAVLIGGCGRYVRPDDGPGIGPLIRPEHEDLFR